MSYPVDYYVWHITKALDSACGLLSEVDVKWEMDKEDAARILSCIAEILDNPNYRKLLWVVAKPDEKPNEMSDINKLQNWKIYAERLHPDLKFKSVAELKTLAAAPTSPAAPAPRRRGRPPASPQ